MLDSSEESRAVARSAWEHALELGHRFEASWMAQVELMNGDLPAATDYYEIAYEAQESTGATGPLATTAAEYGRVLAQLGRYDEADALVETARRLSVPDDVSTEVDWRRAQALLHSARGQHADAERVAREAIVWARRSDSPVIEGDAIVDLAAVLEADGRREEAIAAWKEALGHYERKEIVPSIRRVRERLAALEPA
jgi:tetratricopeptide (TPR) repeat protein